MPTIVPEALVRYINEGRCVLFAGSGLSAQAGLPTWPKLMEGLVKQVGESGDVSPTQIKEVESLLKGGRYLDVAGFCKDKLNSAVFVEFLRDKLRPTMGTLPESHKLVAQIPFTGIVTTNYDDLLERAHTDGSGGRPRAPTHRSHALLGSLLFENTHEPGTPGKRPAGFYILKAHGDLQEPDSLVLTVQDYSSVIRSNAAFNAVFSAILLTNAVLFVGYSLGDPDLRLLLDFQLATFNRYVPERFALLSGVSSVERDLLWRTLQIRVIPYEDQDGQHQEMVTVLRELAKATAPVPAVAEELPSPNVLAGAVAIPAPELASFILSIRMVPAGLNAKVADRQGLVAGEGTSPLPSWSSLTASMGHAMSLALEKGEQEDHRARYRDTGKLLQSCLSASIIDALRAIPRGEQITLRLSQELETMPWEWLQVNRQFLCVRHPLSRLPLNLSDAARGLPGVTWPPRVLLIGDPSSQLPGALQEVRELSFLYQSVQNPTCASLVQGEATYHAVVSALRSGPYDIIHFAGHAWYDELEPYLQLGEGVLLRASELGTLLSAHPPAILILNSHFTSFVPPGVELSTESALTLREQLTPRNPRLTGRPGFSEVAVRTGVGAFLGCFGSPSDNLARVIGVQLHKELLKGTGFAEAVHRACARQREYRGDASHLLYSVSGYGKLAIGGVPSSP